MNFLNIQNTLNKLELDIFTLNDIIKITGQSNIITKSTLSRLTKQNKILRIKKGVYAITQIEDKFQLNKAFKETYIGLYSALEYYQSTTQRFNNLDMISKNTLNTQKIQNINIKFHKLNKKMFFGYEKNESGIFISTIEKTIIDCIHFSSQIYLTEIDTFIDKMKNKISTEILFEYLKKIDSSVLNKRTGYLLERHGIMLEGLNINNKYEKLNQNLNNSKNRNKKWKLIINEEL
jgi:predicted transcriptional regulator of viral defense system